MKRHTILILGVGCILISQVGLSASNENSFTPTKLEMPIFSISLSTEYNGGSSTALYQCAAQTESGCLQNLLDPALGSLITGSGHLDPGTYQYVNIGTCKSSGAYHAYITGSVSLGGTTYYTKASGSDPLSTTAPAEASSVEFSGCAQIYKLPKAITIAAEGSSDLTLTLFVNLTRIAFARIGTAPVPGGCTQGVTNSLCAGYPDVVPYQGTTNPGLEVYHISTTGQASNTAYGQVLLLTDPKDGNSVIGGMTRRLYSETSQSNQGGFDTALKAGSGYSLNTDGLTYRLENYGSSATGEGYLVFPNFERQTHNGTATRPGSTFNYTATKQ